MESKNPVRFELGLERLDRAGRETGERQRALQVGGKNAKS